MKVHRSAGGDSFWRLELETRLLHRLVRHRWFALTELLLVIVSGVAWILIPEFGIWFTLLTLLPWGLRLLARGPAFHRTPFDWVIAIFFITAWVGYWASYDKSTAWVKVWLIATAILLYFALSAQPKQNLRQLSLFSFTVGICLSIYFFLTYDFAIDAGSFGSWWVYLRPQVSWAPIPHGYLSGLIAITSIFAADLIWSSAKNPNGLHSIVTKLFVTFGIVVISGALVLTWSRGILVAGIGALGMWIFWKILMWGGLVAKPWMRSLFPSLVVVCLVVIIIIVYLGPASMGGTSPSTYGKNTRAELFARGTQLLVDYPITGAGLNSFPGLYSQYMLVIPFYYFINSYNLFLDVAIEQGLVGGLAFILVYFGCVWLVSQTIIKTSSQQIHTFSWLSLFVLVVTIVHGWFYDYLYNDAGVLLLFFPAGISMIAVLESSGSKDSRTQSPGEMFVRRRFNNHTTLILVAGLITVLVLNSNRLLSIWYANLGAVKMSQVELASFPTDKWVGPESTSHLAGAEVLLLSALQHDSRNQTANHRLGLISMLRQDFDTASLYLEKAHKEAPAHRGITKTLAYCYVWLGKTEKAQLLLAQIPESRHELEIYIWWWGTQGRADLAEEASIMVSRLE